MSKLIKNWMDLDGLESENYKIRLKCSGILKYQGWICPKEETKETEDNYFLHHVYLSPFIFHKTQYEFTTKLLQYYGFDVELQKCDKY